MSRPSKAESLELRRLETVAALLYDVLTATGFLAIRLRQVRRRAPQVIDVVDPGQQELARIVDNVDQARELLGAVLEEKQRERSLKNSGGDE
jgi:hypothetical protein